MSLAEFANFGEVYTFKRCQVAHKLSKSYFRED